MVNETPYTGPAGRRPDVCRGRAGRRGHAPAAFQPALRRAELLRPRRPSARPSDSNTSRPPKSPTSRASGRPSWNGPEWPFGIRIEMAPLEPSPARLQPVTVTAPIYINRNPGVQYEDRISRALPRRRAPHGPLGLRRARGRRLFAGDHSPRRGRADRHRVDSLRSYYLAVGGVQRGIVELLWTALYPNERRIPAAPPWSCTTSPPASCAWKSSRKPPS